MSQIPLINKVPAVSCRFSPPRMEGAERATHYLHLVAFPCEKCNGPVILGWTGTRQDDISKETKIKEVGAICLSCGCRPETSTDSLQGRHFRPVEWEWQDAK